MNQGPVKWAMPERLIGMDEGFTEAELRESGRVPLIPLSALREVVEGLRKLRDDMLVIQMDGCKCKNCAHYRLIEHLLAGLGEVGK